MPRLFPALLPPLLPPLLLAGGACALPALAKEAPAPDPAAAERAELNRQQAEAAQSQLVASQKVHDDAVAAQQAKSDTAQEAYLAALSAHRKALAKYDADHAKWEKEVAACERHDSTACPSLQKPR